MMRLHVRTWDARILIFSRNFVRDLFGYSLFLFVLFPSSVWNSCFSGNKKHTIMAFTEEGGIEMSGHNSQHGSHFGGRTVCQG
jgi:hypothetical protein